MMPTEFVRMFMVRLCTKPHLPSSIPHNLSLTNGRFRAASELFYFVQKNTLRKLHIFRSITTQNIRTLH